MSGTVAFRVDVSPSIGGGHLARCCALADELQQLNYQVFFVIADAQTISHLPRKYREKVLSVVPGSIEDRSDTATTITQLQPDFTVLDGYQFDSSYRKTLAELTPLVVFDDTNDSGPLHATVVINSLAAASKFNYQSTAGSALLLLGKEYTLLPSSMIKRQYLGVDEFKRPQRLLICFGAADVQGRTLPVVQGLLQQLGKNAPVDVVCGGLCRDYRLVEAYCLEAGFEFFYNCKSMGSLMAKAGLAIAAPGTLLYELAYYSVPAVFAVAADNQLLSAQYHQSQGWCEVFDQTADDSLIVAAAVNLWRDRYTLSQMSTIAGQQFDGYGGARIAEQLSNRFGAKAP